MIFQQFTCVWMDNIICEILLMLVVWQCHCSSGESSASSLFPYFSAMANGGIAAKMISSAYTVTTAMWQLPVFFWEQAFLRFSAGGLAGIYILCSWLIWMLSAVVEQFEMVAECNGFVQLLLLAAVLALIVSGLGECFWGKLHPRSCARDNRPIAF